MVDPVVMRWFLARSPEEWTTPSSPMTPSQAGSLSRSASARGIALRLPFAANTPNDGERATLAEAAKSITRLKSGDVPTQEEIDRFWESGAQAVRDAWFGNQAQEARKKLPTPWPDKEEDNEGYEDNDSSENDQDSEYDQDHQAREPEDEEQDVIVRMFQAGTLQDARE
ncbi:hypothetical protein ACG7TL_001732 [Trametes sanguinea]